MVTSLISRNATPLGTGDQVTQYIYGTSVPGSGVARFDRLSKIVYPDATGSPSDCVTCTWNGQGELLQRTDQNGTTHDYSYDKLGRWTSDAATITSSA